MRGQAGDPRARSGRRRRRRFAGGVVLAVLVLVGGWFTAGPAHAAITDFGMAPAAGPPGTVVRVGGQGCVPGLIGSRTANFVAVTATTLDVAFQVPVRADGSWSGTFTVPSGGAGTLAPTVPVDAVCVSSGIPSLTNIYTARLFSLAASTPTTGRPTTTPRSPDGTGDGTVTVPGDQTVVFAAPSGTGHSGTQGGHDAHAQTGASTASGSAKRASTNGGAAAAALPQADLGARRAAGDGGVGGLGWLGWLLLALLVIGAGGASGYLWWSRRAPMPAGTNGDS